jgi:phosphatidylglycerophosphatase A
MSVNTLPRPSLANPVHLLAFGFGAGCSPRAPGTMGTLLAVVIYLPLSTLSLPLYLAALAAVTLAGIWICDRASRDLGVHDHPGIVWDEIAGFLLTMVAAPPGWAWILAGFLLFRLFDIWKPWPIGWLDRRVTGGLGIMVDDLVAGVFAAACLQLAAWVLG